jgi:hypothetical protein
MQQYQPCVSLLTKNVSYHIGCVRYSAVHNVHPCFSLLKKNTHKIMFQRLNFTTMQMFLPVENMVLYHWNTRTNVKHVKMNQVLVQNLRFIPKELILFGDNIDGFHENHYYPAITKLAYNLSHVQVLGKNNVGKTRKEAQERRISKKDIKCRHDYAERFGASFAEQIQSEFYSTNATVSIEGVSMEYYKKEEDDLIAVPDQVCKLLVNSSRIYLMIVIKMHLQQQVI